MQGIADIDTTSCGQTLKTARGNGKSFPSCEKSKNITLQAALS
jgi:hypothetical protein